MDWEQFAEIWMGGTARMSLAELVFFLIGTYHLIGAVYRKDVIRSLRDIGLAIVSILLALFLLLGRYAFGGWA